MPKKISKSDTLDKAQEAKDRDWLNTSNPSKHFAVGTDITVPRNIGGTILAVSDGGQSLLVAWDSGSVSLIKPIALNR